MREMDGVLCKCWVQIAGRREEHRIRKLYSSASWDKTNALVINCTGKGTRVTDVFLVACVHISGPGALVCAFLISFLGGGLVLALMRTAIRLPLGVSLLLAALQA
jgi:hypothetical protein